MVRMDDIDATGQCCCAGCVGMGPCDLGAACDYGCGAYTLDGGPCSECEAEAIGTEHTVAEHIEHEVTSFVDLARGVRVFLLPDGTRREEPIEP